MKILQITSILALFISFTLICIVSTVLNLNSFKFSKLQELLQTQTQSQTLQKVILEKKLIQTNNDIKCLDGTQPGYYAELIKDSQDYILVFEENIPCIQQNEDITECFKQVANQQPQASSKFWPEKMTFTKGIFSEQRYADYNKIFIKQCDGLFGYGYRQDTLEIDLQKLQNKIKNKKQNNNKQKSDGEQILINQQLIQIQNQIKQKQEILNQDQQLQEDLIISMHFKGYFNTKAILEDLLIDYSKIESMYMVGGTSMLLWANYIKHNKISQNFINDKRFLLLINDNLTYQIDNSVIFEQRYNSIYNFGFQMYQPFFGQLEQYKAQNNSDNKDDFKEFQQLYGENLIKNHENIYISQSYYNFNNQILNFYADYDGQIMQDDIYYNLKGDYMIEDDIYLQRQEKSQIYLENIINNLEKMDAISNQQNDYFIKYGGFFLLKKISPDETPFLSNNYQNLQIGKQNVDVSDSYQHWLQHVYSDDQDLQGLKYFFKDQIQFDTQQLTEYLQMKQKNQDKNFDYFGDKQIYKSKIKNLHLNKNKTRKIILKNLK